MSDDTTEAATTEATETDAKDWKAEAEKWQALARKNEDRAKGNAAAARELEQFKASQMTEIERAVADAEQRGRAAALADVGMDLVRAEFRAQAAGQVDNLDEVLDDLNLAKFADDGGRPDAAAIGKAVARLIPAVKATDFDGGARASTIPLNGDPLLRDLKSKLGI